MEISPLRSVEPDFSDPSDVIGLVRAIWQDILDFEPDDDTGFFESGGDSHLLFVLVDRLSKAGGCKLKTMDVLAADTVAGQADLLLRSRREQAGEASDGS